MSYDHIVNWEKLSLIDFFVVVVLAGSQNLSCNYLVLCGIKSLWIV